jgi:hypothetical protein
VEKVVTKVEGDGRRKAVTVGVVGADGVTVPQEKVEVSGEGLVQVEYATLILTVSGGGRADLVETKVSPLVPPVRLLKLPAKAGDEWDGQMPGGARLSYTVGKPERVKVPAGEFEAVPVALVRTLPGGYSDKFRYWYAPGVGPVKWTAGTGDEFVLKSFTPGKD